MLIDGSAIVAILARRPGSARLLRRLDTARPPHYVTSLGIFDAMAGLARAKVEAPTSETLEQARDAVTAFIAAVGVQEVPLSADIGRRALAIGVDTGRDAFSCFAQACADAYRTDLLAYGPSHDEA